MEISREGSNHILFFEEDGSEWIFDGIQHGWLLLRAHPRLIKEEPFLDGYQRQIPLSNYDSDTVAELCKLSSGIS